jgi:RNA polymerase-binding transcription factor DksA
MTKNEMETFRHHLLKLKQDINGDVATLEDEAFHKSDGKAVGNLSNNSVEDRAELGTDNECAETTISLAENASARLREIKAALERIDEGTFGSCEVCSQEIHQSAPGRPLCTAVHQVRPQGSKRDMGFAGQLVGRSRLPHPQRTTEQETRAV